MSKFEYTALDTAREIRLLKFVGWDEDDQLLKCSLEHIRLDKLHHDPDGLVPTIMPNPRPTYAAISYYRDSPGRPRTIDIDGHQLAIYENAWESLVQLYRRQAEAGVGYSTNIAGRPSSFWIDTVCINQDDIAECNGQVAIMADILSSAHIIYVWLGPSTLPDSPAGEDAARFLASLSLPQDLSQSSNDVQRVGTEDSAEVAKELRIEPSALHSDIPRDQLNNALHDFFTCPYWSCIWTVQELVLASNIEVIWGSQQTRWGGIEFLLTDATAQRDFETLQQQLRSLNVAELVRMKRSYVPRSSTLTSLISSFSSFDAPDPRDRVFALVGLASDPIPVDYALAPEDLWRKLVLRGLSEWSKESHAHVNREANALGQALGVEMTDDRLRWVLLELFAYLKQFDTKMPFEQAPWWDMAPGSEGEVPEYVPKIEGLGARYWDWDVIARLDEQRKKDEERERAVHEDHQQNEGIQDDEDEVETVVQSPLQHLIESQPKDVDDPVKPATEAAQESDRDFEIDATGGSREMTPRAQQQRTTGDIPPLVHLEPNPETVEDIETKELRGRRRQPRTWEYSELLDRFGFGSRSSSPDSDLAYQDDDDWELGARCATM